MIRPARGRLLVTLVTTEEHLGGGRVILPDNVRAALAANQVAVISVGLPERCNAIRCRRLHVVEDSHRCHPCFFCAGQWLISRPRSLLPTPERGSYLLLFTDVLAVLHL